MEKSADELLKEISGPRTGVLLVDFSRKSWCITNAMVEVRKEEDAGVNAFPLRGETTLEQIGEFTQIIQALDLLPSEFVRTTHEIMARVAGVDYSS